MKALLFALISSTALGSYAFARDLNVPQGTTVQVQNSNGSVGTGIATGNTNVIVYNGKAAIVTCHENCGDDSGSFGTPYASDDTPDGPTPDGPTPDGPTPDGPTDDGPTPD